MNLQTMQETFIKQLSQFKTDKAFLDQLKASPTLQPEQQIAIYQNNVRGALQSCLAQIYPVCRTILGDSYFKQLAKGYIQHYPSHHSDLNGYGEAFADFILVQCQQRPELVEFLYLGDLVKLERLYHQVYYAESSPEFDFQAFAGLTEQQQAQCVFQLAPCFQFMASDYPIVSIWQLNQTDATEQQAVALKAENGGVFRKQNRIELFKLEPPVLNVLSLIQTGITLQGMVQSELDCYLPEFIQKGWIVGYQL